MDALGGHVSESSESSHSPLLERHEFSSVSLGSELFANPHNFNTELLLTNYHYTINVPTLDNQGPAMFQGYIDKMDDGAHPESDDHPDSISEEFHDDRRSFSSEYQSEGDDSSSAAPYEEAEKHTPIGSQHQVDLSVINRAIEEDSEEDNALRGGQCVWDPRRADDSVLDSFLTSTRLAGEWNFYDNSRPLGAPDHTQIAPMETVMYALHRHSYDPIAASKELEQAGIKWHSCRPDLTHWIPSEIELFESAMDRVDYKEELNFSEIQRAVKTKNYHEVVEFYWYWKKALRRRRHSSTALSEYDQSLMSLLANDPDDLIGGSNKRKRVEDFVSDNIDWDLVRGLRPPSELLGAIADTDSPKQPLSSRVPINHIPNHQDVNNNSNDIGVALDATGELSLPSSASKRRKISDLIGGESLQPLFASSSPSFPSSVQHGPGAMLPEVDAMMFDDSPLPK